MMVTITLRSKHLWKFFSSKSGCIVEVKTCCRFLFLVLEGNILFFAGGIEGCPAVYWNRVVPLI